MKITSIMQVENFHHVCCASMRLPSECSFQTEFRDYSERLYVCGELVNTLRTGLLNCLNARSRGLNFRHRASCVQGQAFRYSPEKAFYIFNQQIYFII